MWTGTWEDALEQADPALLAECSGVIETLDMLEDRPSLARMEYPVGSEQAKIMLALGMMSAVEHVASVYTRIEDVRGFFESVMHHIFKYRTKPNRQNYMIVDYIYFSMPHVQYHLDASTHEMYLYDVSSDGIGWIMSVVVPGYSKDGWRIFSPITEMTRMPYIVLGVVIDGPIQFYVACNDHGTSSIFGHEYHIATVRGKLWKEARSMAMAYGDRYGIPQYMRGFDHFARHERLDPRYIRQPGQDWVSPGRDAP
jgi:hypothetical protein